MPFKIAPGPHPWPSDAARTDIGSNWQGGLTQQPGRAPDWAEADTSAKRNHVRPAIWLQARSGSAPTTNSTRIAHHLVTQSLPHTRPQGSTHRCPRCCCPVAAARRIATSQGAPLSNTPSPRYVRVHSRHRHRSPVLQNAGLVQPQSTAGTCSISKRGRGTKGATRFTTVTANYQWIRNKARRCEHHRSGPSGAAPSDHVLG